MEVFNFIIDMVQKIVYAGGGFITIMSVISFAQNLKESNGTQLSSSALGILSGVLICICGGAFDIIRSGLA